MKKTLSLLLAISMIVCMFVGCRNNTDKNTDKTDPTGNTENQHVATISTTVTTAPATTDDNNHGETQGNDQEATQGNTNDDAAPEGKQKMWEDVFKNKKYLFKENAFSVTFNDSMAITFLSDDSGKNYASVSGTSAEGDKIKVALYVIDKNTIYFNHSGEENGQEINKWSTCVVPENAESNGGVLDEMGDSGDFITALTTITDIKYVESNGDLDKLTVMYKAIPDADDSELEVIYDVTLSIEYNGQKGEYRYTERSDNGMVSSSAVTTEAIDDFLWSDWEFDKETMKLTKGDETIQCELVKDHLNEDEASTALMEIEINSKTYEIKTISMTDEAGNKSILETIECDDVANIVPIPETTEEIAMKDAAAQFAMMMVILAMSGANGAQ